MKRNDPEHPDVLESRGQMRLMSDLGPREVPKWRKPKPDRGADDLRTGPEETGTAQEETYARV